MMDIPYSLRLAALLTLALCLIILDRLRHRGNARQWEYGCLFLMGTIGAVYGAVNDAVTVSKNTPEQRRQALAPDGRPERPRLERLAGMRDQSPKVFKYVALGLPGAVLSRVHDFLGRSGGYLPTAGCDYAWAFFSYMRNRG